MISGYTIFTSYVLVPTGITLGYGYSEGIHCNYINSLVINTETPSIYEINFHISGGVSVFQFLGDISSGIGYAAHEIYALVQLINNSGYTKTSDIKPIASNWKMVDLTGQIAGHVSGNPLTAAELANTNFKIYLSGYTGYTTYTLDYLNYPTALDNNKLCFGDEMYFFGNVTTDIRADVFTSNLLITLPQNEYNSTTNPTWDQSSVIITEVGIYDAYYNLVAIGKLNNPIIKDSTISRTLAFEIDF